MVLFAALYPMVPILVFISSRYRAPAIPIFAILAALGVRSLCGWIRRKQGVRILAGAGFVIATATVLSLPTPSCEELPNYEVEIYSLLASRAFGNEDELQAEQFTRKALELDPQSQHANQLLGLIQASRGEFDPALARFDNAIEIKSDYWSHYLRGLLHAEMEDFVAAERDFRVAVSMNEKFIWGYEELGRCYDALGNEGEAKKVREQLRKLRKGRRKLRRDSAGEGQAEGGAFRQ
jgi:tetratricopeptide (TPR) repeat protein